MPAEMTFVDLEIGLHRHDGNDYSVKLRLIQPDNDADARFPDSSSSPKTVELKPEEFLQLHLDAAQYGRDLGEKLFANEDFIMGLTTARTLADTREAPLRLRLAIDSTAQELHGYRWETLRDVKHDAPLVTGEHILFSRYLSTTSTRKVETPSQSGIKALVVVASPDKKARRRSKLAEVKVEKELETARMALGDIPFDSLTVLGEVTLNGIAGHLRDGKQNILYLVAHGMLADGEPWLFLEKEDGTFAWVSGEKLVTRIRELSVQPQLVVLVSCQSAGKGDESTTKDGGALAGLGPRLAEAGVPAVVAMQGNFTMKTAEQFMPVFFQELRRDGVVDRAMAVARGNVRERHDWWMPVLFMRLKSGRIWEPLSPDALPEIPTEYFEPKTIYSPPGPFLMGSEPGEGVPEHETPQHEVFLPAFRIGKYPITNEEYALYIQDTEQVPPSELGWNGNTAPPDKNNCPVAGVTWYESLAYCEWLSQKTERTYTLASEAQWEKAARGEDGRRFPWGDDWEGGQYCNTDNTQIMTVDEYQDGISPYGCFDMVGNVCEWSTTLWGGKRRTPDDRYQYPWQADSRRDNPKANDQIRRVYRGGARSNPDVPLRASLRGSQFPHKRGIPGARMGFRIVLILEE